MITLRRSEERGRFENEWLRSRFSFSFADYWDPEHVHFGPLRVINEDYVAPETGFPPHPHQDMEIITYVLEGAVEHRDNAGGHGILKAGEVQVMSAGTGVVHSEMNPLPGDTLHLLQVWIEPDRRGHAPRYGQRAFAAEERRNRWLKVVGPWESCAPLEIHQDASIHIATLGAGRSLEHEIAPGRQAYLLNVAGDISVNGDRLGAGDAAKVTGEPALRLAAASDAELLLLDLP